jgi:hypothetical protein
MLGREIRGSFRGWVGVLGAVALSLGAAPAPVRADEAAAAETAYALIIGSNAAGDGQQELRYAEHDAQAVADLLRDVGGYPAKNLFIALHPDRGRLLATVATLREQLRDHQRRGEQTRVFLYYSGHARANALTIGREEIPLSELRQEILALPSTLTIVVIDACQSGAFSRIKGAEPTADFSFNSVARLNTAGLAVMASSTAAELSQESDELTASFFTHNLLLALRGAGDANQDGRVSLDEAYRYTYQRTLTGTAATAVGAQHATLETELRGKGDIVLTRPATASSSAHILVPAAAEGRMLFQHRRSQSVLAELDKARGEAVRLAVPTGAYTVLVRRGDDLRECDVTLAAQSVVTLDLAACHAASLQLAGAKGTGGAPGNDWGGPRWAMELSLGAILGHRDAYVDEIRQFDFTEFGGNVWLGISHHVGLTASRVSSRHLTFTLSLIELDAQDHDRGSGTTRAQFGWSGYGLGAGIRGTLPLARDRFIPYAQASVGPALAFTTWQDASGSARHTFVGYHLGANAGAAVMPWRSLGFLFELGYYYAPIIENRFGQTHDSGGPVVQVGTRYAF